MATRFALIFCLTRYLTPAEVGIYGIFYVTLFIGITLLGMEFNLYNSRELLSSDERKWPRMIRDQFVYHVIAYILIIPIGCIVIYYDMFAWQYVLWFYLILILSHITQELCNILTTLSRPFQASFIAFVRDGIWVFPLVAVMYCFPGERHLSSLWLFWSVGSLSGIFLCGYYLRHLQWAGVLKFPVDWPWLRRGMRTGFNFLWSTLAIWGIMSVDRYAIKYFWGLEAVGVYTFYSSFARVIEQFCWAGVVAILYPKIIFAYQTGKMDDYRQLMRRLSRGIILVVLVISIILIVSFPYVLIIIGRPIYASSLSTFWVLIVATSIMTITFVPHLGLYVRRIDRMIIILWSSCLCRSSGCKSVSSPKIRKIRRRPCHRSRRPDVISGEIIKFAQNRS